MFDSILKTLWISYLWPLISLFQTIFKCFFSISIFNYMNQVRVCTCKKKSHSTTHKVSTFGSTVVIVIARFVSVVFSYIFQCSMSMLNGLFIYEIIEKYHANCYLYLAASMILEMIWNSALIQRTYGCCRFIKYIQTKMMRNEKSQMWGGGGGQRIETKIEMIFDMNTLTHSDTMF